MPYDEDLANRIRELIGSEADVSKETMFGGLVFLVGGKMSVAIGRNGDLIVRVDPQETDVLLAKPHARPFEMRGRAMQGRVRIGAEGARTNASSNPGSGAALRTHSRFLQARVALERAGHERDDRAALNAELRHRRGRLDMSKPVSRSAGQPTSSL